VFLMVAKIGDQPKERQAAQARKKVLYEEIVAKGEVIYEHGR